MNINPKSHIKKLKLIKIKNSSSLLSFMDFIKNKEKKQINLIPLSRIFKTKIKQEDSNKDISFCENLLLGQNKPRKYPLSINNNSSNLNKYKSLSYKILPFKKPSLKLPNIKSFEESNSEIKETKINSIINKFNEYENKFKKQSKYSFDAGEMAYMHKRLFNGLHNKNEYVHIGLKYNYKKIYSNLFKRIKKIKSL